MSDVVWQALIAAAVTVILALINVLSARRAAAKAEEVKETLAATTNATDAKLTGIAETADTIHALTNSGMTEVRAELKAAREEIRALQQQRVDDAKARPAQPPP